MKLLSTKSVVKLGLFVFNSTIATGLAFLSGQTPEMLIPLVQLGQSVSTGILSGQFLDFINNLNQKDLETAFKEAIQRAFEKTFEEFKKEEKLDEPFFKEFIQEHFSNIPKSVNNPQLVKQVIQEQVIEPLISAFDDNVLLEKALQKTTEKNGHGFILEILKEKKIALSDFRSELQLRLFDYLDKEVFAVFQKTFFEGLRDNAKAMEGYQTVLLKIMLRNLGDAKMVADKNQEKLKKINKNQKKILQYIQYYGLETEFKEDLLAHQKRIEELLTKLRDRLNPNLYLPKKQESFADFSSYHILNTVFVGRELELNKMWAFLDDGRPFCFYAIEAPGGMGKTRLMVELCTRAKKMGWNAGFRDIDEDTFNWEQLDTEQPFLMIIDYADSKEKFVKNILVHFRGLEVQSKLRLILVGRTFQNFNDLVLYAPSNFLDNATTSPMKIRGLSTKERLRIVHQIIDQSDMHSSIDNNQIAQQLNQIDQNGTALYAYLAGIALADGKDISDWSARNFHQEYMKRIQRSFFSKNELWKQKKLQSSLKDILLCATICEYITHEDLPKILTTDPNFRSLDTALASDYDYELLYDLFKTLGDKKGKPGQYLGWKPDRIAERYIIDRVEKLGSDARTKSRIAKLLDVCWQLRSSKAMKMLFITLEEHYQTTGGQHILNWMESKFDEND